jgi:putative transposase
MLAMRVKHDIGRAVDHEGEALESFATKTRNKAGAPAFPRKSLKRHVTIEAIA